MKHRTTTRSIFVRCALALATLALVPLSTLTAADQPILKPDGKPADQSKKLKVFIMMGQSNMVGMGDLQGGSGPWRGELKSTVMSVYEGAYSADTDYDKLKPVSTTEVPLDKDWSPPDADKSKPTTYVLRGQIKPSKPGVYEFSPGYGGSALNVMVVDGTEVYRSEPGKQPIRKDFKFEEGKSYPFKVTYLTNGAGNSGWMSRTDVPGTLGTLVKQQGKYPYLLDDKSQWSERKDQDS
jgi:hypothetical protein